MNREDKPFWKPWYKRIIPSIKYKIIMTYKRLKYPENVWYGNGLKLDTALRCVGKGWHQYITNLYACKPKKTMVTQVKEKYGTLRFYVSSAPEWYHDLIHYYERETDTTCELCGAKGTTVISFGWYKTLCKKCAKEQDFMSLRRWNELRKRTQTN